MKREREPVHEETDERGITYRVFIEQDDAPVRGNALVSGDDDTDRQYEDEILGRLDSGDIWAWAIVTLEAEYQGFKGADVLGACTYRDTQDFIATFDYYSDMKHEAEIALLENVREAIDKGHNAQDVLQHLEK